MTNKTYINSVTVQGFIGADARPKELDGGKIVLNFSVATSRFRGEGEAREQFTEWHRITVWDKLAAWRCEMHGTPVLVAHPDG